MAYLNETYFVIFKKNIYSYLYNNHGFAILISNNIKKVEFYIEFY